MNGTGEEDVNTRNQLPVVYLKQQRFAFFLLSFVIFHLIQKQEMSRLLFVKVFRDL